MIERIKFRIRYEINWRMIYWWLKLTDTKVEFRGRYKR